MTISVKLPNGYNIDLFLISKLLKKDAKVLFLYPKNLDMVQKLSKDFNLTVEVMHTDMAKLEEFNAAGIQTISGNVNTAIVTLQPKAYDFIIADSVMNHARFPYDFIYNCLKASHNLILGNKNYAHWTYRLQLLFYGSLFVKGQHDYIADDDKAWFNHSPWQFSSKDIINLVKNNGSYISKGLYYDSSHKAGNVYDVRGYPNLSAKKAFYLITNESEMSAIYAMDGM